MEKERLVVDGHTLIHGEAEGELLYADVGISFWGGVDPKTGKIVDKHHALHDKLVTGRVLAIPISRGSCTGSSILTELILHNKAPSAIILAEADEILTLGSLLATVLCEKSIPLICISMDQFLKLKAYKVARINGNRLIMSKHRFCSDDDAVPARLSEKRTTISLTDKDIEILNGGKGKAAQVAMEIVLRMAEIQGASKLIDIDQSHIDCCIYTGEASLLFPKKLLEWGAKVSVPTTLNSISVDRRNWRSLGIQPAFGVPASELADMYVAMGAKPTFSCAPYLLQSAPRAGQNIGWAESNAVVFANSVIGAKTAKYPDFLDVCIAILGRAPDAGPHIEENRRPQLCININVPKNIDDAFFPLLGYHVGIISGRRIPIIQGIRGLKPSWDDLKAFSAAFGTTSGSPVYHIAYVTPEAKTSEQVDGLCKGIPLVSVTPTDLKSSWSELNTAVGHSVDCVCLGNPHFSFSEFRKAVNLCRGRSRHPMTDFVITSNREIVESAKQEGYIDILLGFGARIITDTCWCMIEEPIIPPSTRNIATNSAKYAHYAPGLVSRGVYFRSLQDCIDAGVRGTVERELPPWLQQ